MFIRNIDCWNIVYYSEVALVNKLSSLSVEIYSFRRISKYKFYFETKRKHRRVIRNNFQNYRLISKYGFINYLEAMVKKTTLLSVVIASFVLFNVSKRIWKIEVSGDYELVENDIKDELVKNNLILGNYYPNTQGLRKIENNIYNSLAKEIEFLEIKRVGSIINVRYQKRRIAQKLPVKGVNLYASKDGIIRYFDIQSGVKVVKEYDYVRKGDLLVSDVVENHDGNLINVGTLGSVFANTFYVIDVSLAFVDEDEGVIFSRMLDKAKVKISEFISEGESIEIERILNYKIENNRGEMKIYYMLLEDITI